MCSESGTVGATGYFRFPERCLSVRFNHSSVVVFFLFSSIPFLVNFLPRFSEIRNYPLFRQVVGISKDSLCSKEKQQQNLHINLHSPTCRVFFFLVISSSILENTVFSRNQKGDIGAPVTLASLEVLLCVL